MKLTIEIFLLLLWSVNCFITGYGWLVIRTLPLKQRLLHLLIDLTLSGITMIILLFIPGDKDRHNQIDEK